MHEVGTAFLPAGSTMPGSGTSAHEKQEVSIILEGKIKTFSEQGAHILKAGDIISIPEKEVQRTEVIDDTRLIYIFFDKSMVTCGTATNTLPCFANWHHSLQAINGTGKQSRAAFNFALEAFQHELARGKADPQDNNIWPALALTIGAMTLARVMDSDQMRNKLLYDASQALSKYFE